MHYEQESAVVEEAMVEDPEQGQAAPVQPALVLSALAQMQNIASLLGKETLTGIGQECRKGYDLDKSSRSDWEKQTKTAMDLALQLAEEKSWPWPKAANVKYPLITTAAIQFAARAYPAIVPGAEVVKGMVNGADPDGRKLDRARRIGAHMSYQLIEEMEEWEEDTDKLLIQLPIVGCAFRKTYFDTTRQRNTSELAAAKHVVYDHATPFGKLRRISHEIFLYRNDVEERVRSGVWLEIELGKSDKDSEIDDGAFEFIETHYWYDLDEDGYKEPYCVTWRKETGEVVRIAPRFDEDGISIAPDGRVLRIEPVSYWTKYGFMPNPDGGSYDIGLGVLLNPINETVNTVLNQMLDAGTVQNAGGGFIGKGLRMKGGAMRFAPGEYKPVDAQGASIKDNIVPMVHPGPSAVLFQLLGLLIEAGKDVASTKDILTGEQNQSNVPATTTLALIEQGLKVFTAIYKRIHRSLKQEFRKLYRLNRLYLPLESYFRFQDQQVQILLADYQDDFDVCPVSDPHLVTDAQVMAKAQALMSFNGDPLINQVEIRKRFLKAIKEESPEALLVEPQAPPPPPELMELMATLPATIEKLRAEAMESAASAALKVAQAEAQEIGNQMQVYMAQMQGLQDMLRQQIEAMNGQSQLRGMEAPPDDQGGLQVLDGLPPGDLGEMGDGGILPPDAGGLDVGAGGGDLEGAMPGGADQPAV